MAIALDSGREAAGGVRMTRIVCHFSCGAASAVATKLVLAAENRDHVVIFNSFIKEEHPDNRRFLADCETWFGHPVTVLRDEVYGASVHQVWKTRRYMHNRLFTPCSYYLKRELIEANSVPSDRHVYGYTYEELRTRPAVKRMVENGAWCPLIDRGLSHADCLSIVERAGIKLPEMYLLGFNNANCIGCCKGGEGYWNKIREVFPDQFAEVVQIQESIGEGAYLFRDRVNGVRFGLKDLDPKAGRHSVEIPSCSFVCADAEDELLEATRI